MDNKGAYNITSNVFVAELQPGSGLGPFDVFKLEGIPDSPLRYSLIGDAVKELQYREGRTFAQYTPNREENFAIGYLPKGPSRDTHEKSGVKMTYQGKTTLPRSPASSRMLTALLNKVKARELRNILWSPGQHTFYPRQGENLDTKYPGCGLTLFRGPYFRYNMMDDWRIALSLDSSTHYVRSSPILDLIRTAGLDQLRRMIDEARRSEPGPRRQFTGLHFFYDLYKSDVAIDGVDPTPISKIPLNPPKTVHGVVCSTIAEYLRETYRSDPRISDLDESQPGLKSAAITYAPQFLYQTADLSRIRRNIKVEESFYMEDLPSQDRDKHRPASMRWGLIKEYYLKYNFQYVDLGPIQLKAIGPLVYPLENHFVKPMLRTGVDRSVPPEQIEGALSGGMYRPPKIERVFLYSECEKDLANDFYARIVQYAKHNFGFAFPAQPIFLELDLNKMEAQLESLESSGSTRHSFVIGLISDRSQIHHELTNSWGHFDLPSKCVTIPIVEKVCFDGRSRPLEFILASVLTRAGGIPWVLKDELSYECYASVDVGRSLSEVWAMSVVFDRSGTFSVRQGMPTRGEDLDRAQMAICLRQAVAFAAGGQDFIYLRDGDVYEKEREAFESVSSDYPSFKNLAMVSIKKNVPFRVFRGFGGQVKKPQSGDFYFLDKSNVVLCAAGVDEYDQGMPKPIVAEFIPVRGTLDPDKVAEDIFKLTYLNWGSPGSSYSLPAPVKMAHKLAYELSAGIRRHGPPF